MNIVFFKFNDIIINMKNEKSVANENKKNLENEKNFSNNSEKDKRSLRNEQNMSDEKNCDKTNLEIEKNKNSVKNGMDKENFSDNNTESVKREKKLSKKTSKKEKITNKNVKIGVALGGGGMCGVAHIGFLKSLEKHGIKIDYLAGTSMGSVIGGVYASGMKLDDIQQRFTSINKNDILDFNFFQVIKRGFFAGTKLDKLFETSCVKKDIEECDIKFLAYTVDLKTGKEFVFDKGKLSKAMRASSAIPGVFAPIEYEDKLLVDGGVIVNVPFKDLKDLGADIVIAVNCLNETAHKEDIKNTFQILSRSFDIMQEIMCKNDKKLLSDKFDIYLNVNLEGVSPLEIKPDVVRELIDCGEKKTDEIIPLLKDLIKQKQQSK